MKTLWNETEQIEAHITGFTDTGNALLFEAKLLIEPGLHDKVVWQQKAYALIQNYGRKQLKLEIEAVHQKLFSSSQHHSFGQKIRQIFTNR